MPFKSRAQQRFMFAKHPKIAKRWADKYGIPNKLPEMMKKSIKGSGAMSMEEMMKGYRKC